MTFVDIVLASALGQLLAIAVFCVAAGVYKLGQALVELNVIRMEQQREKNCKP